MTTRSREGVNWYLFDATPIFGESGLIFTLLCYDESGDVVQQVPFIEERAGRRIPAATLADIAEARAHAGINRHFLRKIVKKRPVAICNCSWRRGRAGWKKAGRNSSVPTPDAAGKREIRLGDALLTLP
ncbi:MAG: hypothetical protein WDN06_07170 [Asticcacaulis sp.]